MWECADSGMSGTRLPIDVSEQRGVRYLHFGSPWVQGAMRIARPYALELEYTRELMLPLVLRGERDWPGTVLQVGLGAASITRFLYRHRPAARITVVEIAPAVVAAARQYFKLPEDEARVRLVIEDAHDYVMRSRARFDLIVVDGFDEKGRAGMLDSVPFYSNCRDRLGRSGMLSVNLLTRTRSAAAAVRRLREAFDERVLELAPSEAGNVVVLAGSGLPIRERAVELRARARRLKEETGLDLAPTLARLRL
jgi:spermidine synthase